MRVLRFLLEISKPYKWYLLAIVLLMTFVAIDANGKPYLIKMIIDAVSANNYSYIWLIVSVYGVMQFGLVLTWASFDLFSSKLYPPMTAYITKSLLNKLNNYPYRFFQEHLSGSISSKLSDVANFAPQMINTILIEFFQIFLMLTIIIFLLAKVHFGFAIAIIIWIAIFLATGYVKMKKAAALSKLEAESDSQVWGNIVDYITNMFSVKIFSSYSHEINRINKKLTDLTSKRKTSILYLRTYFMTQGSLFSLYILSCLCGMIYLSKNKLITPGDFALVFMLNFEIINRLFQITTIVKNFITNLGTVDQALIILEDIPDIQDRPDAKILKIKTGQITFDNVKFHYKGTEPIFQNKSIEITAGQKVGLVGYSGGGKSTFVNLILRLYDVTDGAILIDGQDIRDVTQDSLRENIAMIPQDPSLFHRSLMDNIRYGRADSTDEEVIEAAIKAHAHEFISTLPQGYDSLVGERGVKLSGGQRQRIAIARAILKNAPILILDEATSQLDSVTESLIQESLWELMQNKTTIVIAHRLSTLLHMDRILVFDKGNIVEDGTHSELLAKEGLYKTLWDAQVGGFLGDEKTEDEV
ncbi:MAG: ABC transporter ATP-binding protein [Gammaproteobacteria bacterium]